MIDVVTVFTVRIPVSALDETSYHQHAIHFLSVGNHGGMRQRFIKQKLDDFFFY